MPTASSLAENARVLVVVVALVAVVVAVVLLEELEVWAKAKPAVPANRDRATTAARRRQTILIIAYSLSGLAERGQRQKRRRHMATAPGMSRA
jgi:predicted ABC-type sugar transport system permease subunit